MAISITVADMDELVELDSDIDTAPFISMATELVNEFCSDAGYTDARLNLIAAWLACHFYVIRDPRASSESAGVSQSYRNPNVGMMIHGTKEGQQALLLDTAGGLASLSKATEGGASRTVGLLWLGTSNPDATEEE